MFGGDGEVCRVAHKSAPGRQGDVGGHAGAHAVRRIVDAHLHAEYLMDAFFHGLHVARKKFGLLVDLFDGAVEDLVGEGVHANLGLLAEMYAADLGFGNIDADVNLIALEERGDWGVGGDQVAGTHVENFDGRGGRGQHLAFAEAGFIIGESGFGGGDVFDAIAIFEFFESRLGLVIASGGGGDFLGAIAAVEFVELVLEILFLREGHLPGGIGGVALLLGDEILLGQSIVALGVEVRTDFVGIGAVEIGLRGGDVFLAVAVYLLLIFGFG